MRLLFLDIETAPNLAYVWGLWKQNINLDALVEPGYTMCWAAKWRGERKVYFDSLHQSAERAMIKGIHGLINEADAVVHYNGKKFDMPTLNKEFLKLGLKPPAPYKEIDLLPVARKQFRFPSNKLDYLARVLGVGQKVKHIGYELWTRCMSGDEKAWRMMERYNRGDVTLLEKVYDELLPWIPSHPNAALYSDDDRPVCRNCGSANVQRRGTETTATRVYARFQCRNCGKWLRGTNSIKPPEKQVLV